MDHSSEPFLVPPIMEGTSDIHILGSRSPYSFEATKARLGLPNPFGLLELLRSLTWSV